jgi:hypothetical protein
MGDTGLLISKDDPKRDPNKLKKKNALEREQEPEKEEKKGFELQPHKMSQECCHYTAKVLRQEWTVLRSQLLQELKIPRKSH